MSFTRFNYDKDRVNKSLEQATGHHRYVMNVPGPYKNQAYFADPQIRMQKFGGNGLNVFGGHPIDIDNDLTGRPRKLTKSADKLYPYGAVQGLSRKHYNEISVPTMDQTRVTHPAHLYRDLEQSNKYPLFEDHQANIALNFHNNLNTRLLERDSYVPKLPVFKNMPVAEDLIRYDI